MGLTCRTWSQKIKAKDVRSKEKTARARKSSKSSRKKRKNVTG